MNASAQLPLPAAPLGPRGRLWVGYSGGGDSTALLHALSMAYPGRVRAIHIHHGLQAVADEWVRHCRRICRALGVPLRVERVAVQASGEGLEAAAREARYQIWTALLRAGDVLATAHHLDDQAETVLLRVLRGSGVAGLAGMRERRPLGAGVLWRPLLSVERALLRQYLRSQELSWVEDAHNADPKFSRAMLRTQILPPLQAHFPELNRRLVRLGRRAAAADGLLAELAAMDAAAVQRPDGAWSVSGLLALSADRRHNLLYALWRAAGGLPPPEQWFLRLDREVLQAAGDRAPVLTHAGMELRRYRDLLYLMQALLSAPAPGTALSWGRRRDLRLPVGCGVLRIDRLRGLEVRFAVGGERLRLAGEVHSRSLKALCQRAGVPPWVRQRMPLVWRGTELLAIGDRWLGETAVAERLSLQWIHALPGWSPASVPVGA